MLDAGRHVLCLSLALLACSAVACADDPAPQTRELSENADHASTADSGGPGKSSGPQAAPCAELKNTATMILESHQTCTRDEDCRAGIVPTPCPAAPSCNTYVRKDTDVLWAALSELKREYESSCGKCPAAKCAQPEATVAYCNAGHCAGRRLAGDDVRHDAGPARDAGAPADASVSRDGGVSDGGAASSPFACAQNLDCVVKDVGNCCGYYPRCANVSATFAPPDCSGGQAGVCGFPAVDSCECRQKTCVSLSGGQLVGAD